MEELSRLFDAYRSSYPDPEASPSFMPGLWRKIDRRRGFSAKLWTYARGLMTASAATCLLLLGLQFAAVSPQADVFATSTYVDALGADVSPEAAVFGEISLAGQSLR